MTGWIEQSKKHLSEVDNMSLRPCAEEDGIKISKQFMALVTLLILLLSTVSTVVAYTVGVKSSVESLNKDIEQVRATIDTLSPKVHQNEKNIAVIKEHYQTIDINNQEIRNKLYEK